MLVRRGHHPGRPGRGHAGAHGGQLSAASTNFFGQTARADAARTDIWRTGTGSHMIAEGI